MHTYWLSLRRVQREDFARACGTSPQYLYMVSKGIKKPGEKLAIAIERESAGRIRVEQLRPDVDWAYLRGTAPAEPELEAACG